MDSDLTVKDIVREKLIALGADGLCDPDSECGCPIDDICCCDSDCRGCVPARIVSDHDEIRFVPLELAEISSQIKGTVDL
jgi:hypothetical protein